MPSSDTVARDAFVDLLCQDEDLVRAEFDAIIAAAWPVPPMPPALPAPPGSDERPPRWPIRPGWTDLSARTARLLAPPPRWRGRQRSPPSTEEGDAIEHEIRCSTIASPGPDTSRRSHDGPAPRSGAIRPAANQLKTLAEPRSPTGAPA
jgi:hypothetical protein